MRQKLQRSGTEDIAREKSLPLPDPPPPPAFFLYFLLWAVFFASFPFHYLINWNSKLNGYSILEKENN